MTVRVAFVATVAVLVAAAFWQRTPLGLVLVLGYLGWLFLESRAVLRSGVGGAADPTVLPYTLARVFTVAVAAAVRPPWPAWSPWQVLPVAAFAGGIALRQWAIRELGRFYAPRVQRHEGHAVVTTGPYALVRHPAYTGALVAHLGFVAFFLNAFSVAGLALQVAATAWRIRAEERMLSSVRGYAGYAAGTARLVPGVW